MKYTQLNLRSYEAHWFAIRSVPPGSRVLDVGCATGYIGRELRKKSCTVIGVENDAAAAKAARRYYTKVLEGDLELPTSLRLPTHAFDVVLCLDVIEHLTHRADLLRAIRRWLKTDGVLILSTPNIAHVSIRWQLLRGSFAYTSWGILDKSHIHFFTKQSLTKLLEETGYTVEKLTPTADFGQMPVVGRFARHVPKMIQFALTTRVPTLLGVQYIAICTPPKVI